MGETVPIAGGSDEVGGHNSGMRMQTAGVGAVVAGSCVPLGCDVIGISVGWNDLGTVFGMRVGSVTYVVGAGVLWGESVAEGDSGAVVIGEVVTSSFEGFPVCGTGLSGEVVGFGRTGVGERVESQNSGIIKQILGRSGWTESGLGGTVGLGIGTGVGTGAEVGLSQN